MDRLSLDANVLFSAAYRVGAGLLELWRLKDVELCTSRYALEEARINVLESVQKSRLEKLVRKLEIVDSAVEGIPRGICLPDKDAPILLGAIAARATHLITGDLKDFGPYFGKKIAGILVLTPGEYLKRH
jgi:predicted nucleic acid-binding protein